MGISFDYSSSGYLDVSVHRVYLPFGQHDMTHAGLPHSEIRVSRPTCGSARLFAAYRVLHRLGTPRHPPYALCSLTISTRGDLFAPSFVAHRLLFVDVALLRLLTKTEALLAIHENLARLCRCNSPFRNIVIRCLCLNPKMSVQTMSV